MSTRRWLTALGGLGIAVCIGVVSRHAGAIAGLAGSDDRAPQRARVEREGPAAGLWTSEARHPAYVPGRLIIKYRDSVTEPVHRLLAQRRSFRSSTTDRSDSLDRLHAKFGARSARPVFRTALEDRSIPAAARQAAVKRLVAGKLEAVRRMFPQRSARATTRELPDLSHVYLVELAAGSDVLRAAAEFGADPHVEYAQPDFHATVQFVPNDPYYQTSGSWGQPYQDLWGLRKIQTESAWDVTQGAGVVVAVVDTGLDATHPDIAANVWSNPGEVVNGVDDDGNGFVDDVSGWNFVSNNNSPADGFGHGTHVSGTILAVGNNGYGIIGVAPQARVMPLKGLDDNGSGTFDNLAAAIVYAARNGADVINNSWGCPFGCPSNPVIEDAVRVAHGLGTVVVFAAGNSASDVANFSPQNMPETITVAASTNIDAAAFFSNFGGGLDVAAPGAGENTPPPDADPFRAVLSLKAANCGSAICPSTLIVGGNFVRQAGTSMAAPHAAGVAALVLSARPSFTVEQVRQAIRRGSDDVGAPGFDDRFGYGRLNATRALAETQPLEALITSPSAGTLSGIDRVEVRGLAAGPGFASYRLEFGSGAVPSSWTTIAASTTPVSPAGSLATWDLSGVRDGVNTLRLSAVNVSGQIYEDRQPVTIDQVVITDPPPGRVTAFRSGDVITISGTVFPADFSRYRIIVRNQAGVPLTNADVTLTNGGLQRVANGVLATWSTANVTTGDYYTISLEVTLTDGSVILETTTVIVDPTLHPGWPKTLGLSGSGFFILAITDHLDTADVNLDGRPDLLAGYGSAVTIFDHTGATLPGWPQTIDPAGSGAIIQKSPAVGDLTGDGLPEVVAANNDGQIFVWSRTGVLLPGWPLSLGGGPTSVSIADVDGNGTNDIVTTDWAGRVDVLSASGASLTGWPRYLSGESILAPPVVGDIDGDGRMEIAVIGLISPNNLYLLGSSGTILPGWPRTINPAAPAGSVFYSYPAMGELDDDSFREIVVGAADGRVLVLNHDGTDMPGWPQMTRSVPVHSPAIADLDGDGRPEIVAGLDPVFEGPARVNLLYAWHRDGTLLPGWPVRYDGPITHSFFGFGSAALADLDGDGRPDVIASNEATYPLSAYNISGAALPGFPKPTIDIGAFAMDTAAVADLDGDGLLEMAWIDFSSNLYVWDLQGPRTGARPWPMFHHDARHTGAADPDLVLANRDLQTLAGAIVSGSYLDTRASDDVREVLQTLKTRRGNQLSHTWRFDNVPAASHTLVIEGFRPVNTAGDNFQFSWSADNLTFNSIPGARVNFATETRIEIPFGPGTLGRTVYVRVDNTATTGSKSRSLYVDYLVIRTVPPSSP